MGGELVEDLKKGFSILKSDLSLLFDVLGDDGELIAPVKNDGWLRMEKVGSVDDVCFEGLSWYTSKKYYFPDEQVLFKFDGNKITRISNFPKRVLFGLRFCDLNAFKVNDKLFLEQKPANKNYENYRKNITLVGLWCDEVVDEYCFCSSIGLEHYYDICLFDKGESFHIKSGSERGNEILNKLGLKSDEYFCGDLPLGDMKLLTKNIHSFYSNDDVWKKGASDCLSCGDCTTLCPTCLCFDVEDDVELDLVSGVRFLKWDSCMFEHFTLVAGDYVYRNTLLNRFKHRIYHKLDYFPEKFEGLSMCTGCGRCIRGCPEKINWVALVNEMVEGRKNV